VTALPRPRQCLECLNWGFNYNCCDTCRRWRQKQPTEGACRRCGRVARVSTAEGVCRPCLQAVRSEPDIEWLEDPDGCRPRDLQLSLIFPGLGPGEAHPLRRTFDTWAPDRVVQRLRVKEKRDDPAICPPSVPGQMLLFRPTRVLDRATAARIKDRDLQHWDTVKTIITQRAAELGQNPSSTREVGWCTRLILAVREADGGGLIPVRELNALPNRRAPLADVLHRAGLLGPPSAWPEPVASKGRRPRPAREPKAALPRTWRKPQPRSCGHCQAWGLGSYCSGCRGWRDRAEEFESGDCTRCKREDVLLNGGMCRGCCLDVSLNGLETRDQSWRQLMLGSPFNFNTTVRHVYIRQDIGYHPPWKRRPEPPRAVSEHRLAPGQETLFPLSRDWSKIASLPLAALPRLTASDDAFIDGFLEETHRQQWGEHPRVAGVRALRVLASWLGTDAQIPEEDIQSLAAVVHVKPGPRLAQFLASCGKLIPAPRQDPCLAWVEAFISQHTRQVADELRIWVKVLRGGGRWEHPATAWPTIRRYMTYLRPVLAGWQASGVSTLREISRDEMRAVLRARQGRAAEAVHVAARSLFRALKQERAIFTDPTRGLTVAAVAKTPRSIPSDHLRG